MKYNPNKGNNKNPHHHLAKSYLHGTYTYHWIYRFFPKIGPYNHSLFLHIHLGLWPHMHQRTLTLVYQAKHLGAADEVPWVADAPDL
jgi:hypothetical protein